MKKSINKYVFWTYISFFLFLFFIGLIIFLKLDTLAEVLKIVSSWTPTFVFIVLFNKIYPNDNLLDFIKRQFSEKIKITNILMIILIHIVILLGSIYVTGLVYNLDIGVKVMTSIAPILILFLRNLITGALGEEIGWRGFLLNELQKKHSGLVSAIYVGLIWAFWHTLLWFLSGLTGTDLLIYIACFLVTGVSSSIVITGFYNLNKNLLIPILIHLLLNFVIGIQVGNIIEIFTGTSILYALVALSLIIINYKKCLYGKSVKSDL